MSDVDSLGMTILKVTGDTVVATVELRGNLPRSLKILPDNLWSLPVSCWSKIPEKNLTTDMYYRVLPVFMPGCDSVTPNAFDQVYRSWFPLSP